MFVMFSARVLKQTAGIPMGTNCSPLQPIYSFIRLKLTSCGPSVEKRKCWLNLAIQTSNVIKQRLRLLSNTTGATSKSCVTYPSGAPELAIFLQGSCYSSFIFQCSNVCSMFVFRFILLVMGFDVVRLNDFCLSLWYLWYQFSF